MSVLQKMERKWAYILAFVFILTSFSLKSPVVGLVQFQNDGKLLLEGEEAAAIIEELDELDSYSEPFIPANYSVNELPPKLNGKINEMTFSVLIMGVRDIKEIAEELSVEMNMYMQWRDTRLNNQYGREDMEEQRFVVLKPKLLNDIWHPDIFFENMKSVTQPTVVSTPASLRIYNDSALRYSARITVTMACEMRFEYYPADTQKCNIDLKSYGYNDKQLVLSWYKDGAKFGKEIALANYYLGIEKPSSFSFTSSSGTFPGLRFTVTLTRKLSYHIIQTYIPSSLLVIVSWLSFLVPPSSVPGRMAICITCLLTLITMFASVRQLVPNVSYIKALDIWMVACVFFVFLALAEFTVVLKLLSVHEKRTAKSSTPSSNNTITLLPNKLPEVTYLDHANFLEECAPIVLGLLFGLFNLIYWSWLISNQE